MPNAEYRLVDVCRNFLGNKRSPDYENLVNEMLVNFKVQNAILKVHFQHHQLGYFPVNSNLQEHGEPVHQDMPIMEERYSDRVSK